MSGRNWDLIAATVIVVFAAFGTAATSLITSSSFPTNRWLVEPAVQSVRPQIVEIHSESREAAAQIRRDLQQARHDVQSDFCGVRDELRKVRSELREEIRSLFR